MISLIPIITYFLGTQVSALPSYSLLKASVLLQRAQVIPRREEICVLTASQGCRPGQTLSLFATTVAYPLKYPINGSKTIILSAPSIYGAGQFLTHPSVPDTTRQNYSMSGVSYPGVVWGTTSPTDYIRFDVVAANTSYIPNLFGFDPTVTYDDLVYPDGTTQMIAGLECFGTAIDYGSGPFDPQPEAAFRWLDPKLEDGDYRLVGRALKPGGDYEEVGDWEGWLSAIVRIV